MGWIKVDDHMLDHPKVIGLSDAAFRLHLRAMCYCSRYLTDGHISVVVARGWAPKHIAELETAGLWEATAGAGWQIHDYLAYQRSRAHATRQREEAAERMRGQRGSSAEAEDQGDCSQNVRANIARTNDDVREMCARTARDVREKFDRESKSKKEHVPDGFAAWWESYPKKVNKPGALKAWRKLNPDATLAATLQACVAVQRQTADWVKEGGKFIPYPASYLNGRRWEDHVEVATQTVGPVYDEWAECATCGGIHVVGRCKRQGGAPQADQAQEVA